MARYEDVEASLRNVGTFRADLGRMSGVDGIEAVPSDQLFLSEISGPRHAQIRRLFNATFGPQRTAKVEPFIGSTCHALLDQLLARHGEVRPPRRLRHAHSRAGDGPRDGTARRDGGEVHGLVGGRDDHEATVLDPTSAPAVIPCRTSSPTSSPLAGPVPNEARTSSPR